MYNTFHSNHRPFDNNNGFLNRAQKDLRQTATVDSNISWLQAIRNVLGL